MQSDSAAPHPTGLMASCPGGQAPPPPPPDTTVAELAADLEEERATATAMPGRSETTCGGRAAGIAHTSAVPDRAVALGSDCRLASSHFAEESGLDGRAGSGSSSPPSATSPQASLASRGGPEAGPAAQQRGSTGSSQHPRPVSGGGPAGEPGRQLSVDSQDSPLVRYADGSRLEKGKPPSPASAASSRCLEEATTSSPLRGTGAHQAAASGTDTTRGATDAALAASSSTKAHSKPLSSVSAAPQPTGLSASCPLGLTSPTGLRADALGLRPRPVIVPPASSLTDHPAPTSVFADAKLSSPIASAVCGRMRRKCLHLRRIEEEITRVATPHRPPRPPPSAYTTILDRPPPLASMPPLVLSVMPTCCEAGFPRRSTRSSPSSPLPSGARRLLAAPGGPRPDLRRSHGRARADQPMYQPLAHGRAG